MSDDKIYRLPDGSGCFIASFPLPKDHWLYADRGEWDSVRDEYAECPLPVLNDSYRAAIVAAIRYAVRGATMCGKEMDFDPDAIVQNAVYALCGPCDPATTAVTHKNGQQARAALTREQQT
jgi:hypothetical protein